MSKLKLIIEKLSKASPESVHTFNDINTNIFDYLHIETPVETSYINLLESKRNEKSIVFLCGSSGDGKSAIIANNKVKFEKDYNFHVDATHSFKPTQTAVEALDDSFSKFSKNDKSLVVGINIGILMNYTREGSSANNEVINAINNFLDTNTDSKNIYFINFEDYSKFEFKDEKISSFFIKDLLEKITFESDKNPFFDTFSIDKDKQETSIIHQNYKLLSLPTVQDSIIELLITVNLKYDQFITTRSLLDFIYTLLKGPKLLINQIFEDDSNNIIQNIRKEDPVLIRTYKLDKFILERSSKKEDLELNEFIDDFNKICPKPILDKDRAFRLIRTFYFFRNSEIYNNYHLKFKENFDDKTITDFIYLVNLHKKFEPDNKKALQSFYKSLKKAILFYVNKKIPSLSKDDLFTLSSSGKMTTAVPIEITPNWKRIKDYTSNSFTSFPIFLKVNDTELKIIDLTLNMFILLNTINNGYRPNKHDRNTIIIFEELIQSIIEKATNSKEIVLIMNNKKTKFKSSEDEIKVTEYA